MWIFHSIHQTLTLICLCLRPFETVLAQLSNNQKSLLFKYASVSPLHIPPSSLHLVSTADLHLLHYLEHVTLSPLWLAEASLRCYSLVASYSQLPAGLSAVLLMLLHGKVVHSQLWAEILLPEQYRVSIAVSGLHSHENPKGRQGVAGSNGESVLWG